MYLTTHIGLRPAGFLYGPRCAQPIWGCDTAAMAVQFASVGALRERYSFSGRRCWLLAHVGALYSEMSIHELAITNYVNV